MISIFNSQYYKDKYYNKGKITNCLHMGQLHAYVLAIVIMEIKS